MSVCEYNRDKLEELYNSISQYTTDEESGVERFLKCLNDCGVKFFVLSHLQHTYLDGAAFMDNENPVIVYTGRYKRLDNFWFTLAHEIAHVLLHLKEDLCFMDDDSHQNNALEAEANALAQKQLKHDEIVKYFSDYTGYMTQSRLALAAATLGINRSIIIGSLAHDGKVKYNQINANKINPLDLVPNNYISD